MVLGTVLLVCGGRQCLCAEACAVVLVGFGYLGVLFYFMFCFVCLFVVCHSV